VSEPPTVPLPTDDELPDDVRGMLAKLPPLNVFRMVGHSPASVRPFLQLGGSLLGYPGFSARNREIAILRVATVTAAAYEWTQHTQLGRGAGISEEEIELIADPGPVTGLDEDGNLICRVADEISRDVRLSDETLRLALDRYGTEVTAHLVLVVAYYNMVSRFLESMRVELEDQPLLQGRPPGSDWRLS
jgi:alkylhydroperoxidase family enzyme